MHVDNGLSSCLLLSKFFMYNAERLRLKRPLIHSKVRKTQIAI